MLKIILLTLLITQAALGARHTWKGEAFIMDVPASWQSMTDFFGVPVTFLDPQKPGSPRATIQVIPTEAQALKFDDSELSAFSKTYPERKRLWASKKSAAIQSLIPASYTELNGQRALTSGVAFHLDAVSFIEKSFFVNCKQKLYHLKLLAPAGDEVRIKTAEAVLRSFKCAP